jgi:hypothetical protein
MCGIVYFKSFIGKNVSKQTIAQFQKQRTRGTSGFGFYIPAMNRLTHNERERRILRLLKREKTSEVLFHHRFPTSTANVRNACHPFSTHNHFKHNYVLVHNGVIWNNDELEREHTKLGIEYVSRQENGQFNDSEALLYDIALFLEGEQTELKAAGDNAFIVIENDEKGIPINVHFGRNLGNPLMMDFQTEFLSLTSEGTGVNIVPDQLYTFNYAECKLSLRPVTIPIYEWRESRSYGGYEEGNYGHTAATGFRTPKPTKKSKWLGREGHIPVTPSALPAYATPTATPSTTEPKVESSLAWEGWREQEYDADSGHYIDKPAPAFDSPEYYERLYWQGQSLATELWGEAGSLDLAVTNAQEMLDSARGKLNRLADRLKIAKPKSKKWRHFKLEAQTLKIREDILLEALDAFGDLQADEFETLKGVTASPKVTEAQNGQQTATS